MGGSNPKLYLININAFTKFGEIYPFVFKILSGKEILITIKGYNSVRTFVKQMTVKILLT